MSTFTPSRVGRRPYSTCGEFTDAELMDLWRAGFDTCAIAAMLSAPEHEVERRLHRILDARRAGTVPA